MCPQATHVSSAVPVVSLNQKWIVLFLGQVEDIAHDNSLNLIYMAGFVAYRHHDLCGKKADFDFADSSFFLAEMNRGKLSYPSEELFSLMRIAFLSSP